MELQKYQLQLLSDAKQIRDDEDEPVVIRRSTLEDAKTIFGEYLEAQHGLSDPMSLPLEAQVRQLAVDAVEDSTSVSTLLEANQTPETAGASADEIDAAEALAGQGSSTSDLSPADRAEIEEKWQSAETLRGRCPEYVKDREREICRIAGTDDVNDALEVAGLVADH